MDPKRGPKWVILGVQNGPFPYVSRSNWVPKWVILGPKWVQNGVPISSEQSPDTPFYPILTPNMPKMAIWAIWPYGPDLGHF